LERSKKIFFNIHKYEIPNKYFCFSSPTNYTMKQKYFLYARKSSEAEEKQAMSIEAQIHELTALANKENLFIAETFIESKSAKTPGRKEFARMIEKIHASKEPVSILAWHPDRLARNSIDGGQIIYLIDTRKICGLKFSTFWFEPTPQGLFMLQVAFGQSKYYSDNLSENVKRGIRQKIRRGEWIVSAPLGYVNNPKTRNIEPHPVEAKIVKKIFQEFAEGKHSLVTARERLSFFGILSRNNKTMIGNSSMYRILTNPIYTGIIQCKGELFEGKFEPLISQATFEAVQARLKVSSRPRKSKHKHDFALTGLFTCGECGCAITAQFAKGNGGTYRYYRCTKKKVKCSQGYLREDVMQNEVRDLLQKVAIPVEWGQEMLAQVEVWEKEEQKNLISFAQSLEAKIKETEEKLDKLVNAFLEETIDKDTYLKKKEELIKLKIELSQKKSDFGQKGKFWLEPLKNWIESALLAGKLANSKDFCFEKSLLEKIGSNRILKDKKLRFDFAPPFSFVSKYKGMAGEWRDKNKTGENVCETQSPVWWGLVQEARNLV